MGCLYKINFPNGKEYIGVTRKTAEIRFKQHVSDSKRGNERFLCRALRKHGYRNCKLETLVISDDDEYLKYLEIKSIEAFKTQRPHGYNSTSGGNGVVNLDSESEKRRIKNMRETMSTEEYKIKQKEIQSAVWTDERKSVRSDSVKKLWENEGYRNSLVVAHTGRTDSKETKLKKSQSINTYWETADRDKSSEHFKNLWEKPEHRLLMGKVSVRTKKSRAEKMKAHWSDAEWAENCKKSRQGIFTSEFKEKMSETQKIVMQNVDLKIQIAISMSKYKGKSFKKIRKENPTKKEGLVRNTWDNLSEAFTLEDALRLGWKGSKHIDRAILSGWIKLID